MNAERLLERYEQISEAPDAIARLRRFVLDLAVRGKLVEQDPTDEPASNLLKIFTGIKADLINRKIIRKPKALKPILDVEQLSYTPLGWETQRLGNLSILITKGSTPTSYGHEFTQEGVNFLKVESIQNDRVDASSVTAFISTETHEFLSRSQLEAGDILFSIAGSIGTCAVVSADILPANTNQALAIIRGTATVFNPDFLLLLLRSFVSDAVKDRARGGAMNNVSLTDLQNLVLPIPPLAEQHRIVAKVDELMALCDRLEKARKTREETRDKLTVASLARLTAPDTTPEDFPAHARFALEALPALTKRPDQIKTLRQTILNLAVRGKLVEQDPTDEPASELLKRIAAERARLVKAGAIRSKKQPAPVDDAELPFASPAGWSWTTLVQAFVVTGGIQKTPARTPRQNAFPYLGVGNVYRNRIDLTNLKQFELKDGDIEKFGLKPFDIMVVEGNGSASEIGRCAMWEGQIKECVHQNHLIRCRPIEPEVSRYTMLYLNSPLGMSEMRELAITSAGLYNLSVGKISKILIPLPPLAEQHRIVAKVDELMVLCDRLEAALTTADTTRTRLLEALLHEALEPSANALAAAE